MKTFEFPGNISITLDIWDTAGQEKYRSINRFYYKNVKAVVLVYDITDKKSFNELKNYWYGQVKQNCGSDVIIAVAESKYDLYELRQVSNEEGEEFAKSIGSIFNSTSAKNDDGIKSLFENIAKKILEINFNFVDNEHKTNKNYKKRKDSIKEKTENNKDNSRNSVKLDATKSIKKKKLC